MDFTKDLYDIIAMPMPVKQKKQPKVSSTKKLKLVIRKLKHLSLPKYQVVPQMSMVLP